MPDPKQMSGIPRPVDDLPNGSISVRLIRGQLSNNITNHPVQLRVGDKTLTVKTDDGGRAQFDKIEAGATVRALADVDGEHLESQDFAAPPRGGIRLMLVATDPNKKASPQAAPVEGEVKITNESRIVMEPGDEAVTVYYLLEISNPSSAPVQPKSVFMFDVPKDALGTTLMQGSTPQASTQSGRVRIEGPFAPGATSLQVGFEIPARSGDITISQKFPAPLEHLAVVVKKVNDTTTLSSPQIARQQEFPVAEGTYIAGTGAAIPAGQPINLDVSGLPHHSAVPSSIALALSVVIVAGGMLMGTRPDHEEQNARAAERKRLIGRRDKLFNDLVRLENDLRGGRADERKYAARREELLAALENVYGALDGDESSPDPADRAGVAA